MRLIVNVEGERPKTVDIEEEVFTVGRSSKNSLQIKSDSISRSQLRVRSSGGVIYVTDLGSTNATFINNEKLKPDQEVSWHTFFPIILGENVSISYETVLQDTVESKKREALTSLDKKNITTTRGRLNIAKPKPEKREKSEKKSSGVKPLYITMVMILGMGYFFYHYHKDKEFKETDLSYAPKKSNQAAILKGSSELIKIPTALIDAPKCQTQKEQFLCQTLKTNLENAEGVVQKEKDLVIFINFGLRIKNVEIEPSFSMANDTERMTYLMAYMAFNNDMPANVKVMEFENLLIVDVSSGPTRVNQVLKAGQANLLKLSPIDLQTIFNGVLNKDPHFFNSLLFPLVEVGYAK